jgi:hypothetical protein
VLLAFRLLTHRIIRETQQLSRFRGKADICDRAPIAGSDANDPVASTVALHLHVRSRGETGSGWPTVKVKRLTQMYGPAVRSKKISTTWR